MGVREDIRRALYDAAHWQDTLADANKGYDADAYREAVEQAARYRRILKRRYGTSQSRLDQLLSEATPVGLAEIQLRRKITK